MKKFGTLFSMMVATGAFLMLAVTPSAIASDSTYTFTLTGPQTTTNGTQTIEVSGSGSFDITARTVVASGSFNITDNSNGAVASKGNWNATAFTSFCLRGGPDSGHLGGVLVITVTLTPSKGEPIRGVTMTVNCLIGSGCNAGDEGVSVTGVAGFVDFVEHTRGATLFHLND